MSEHYQQQLNDKLAEYQTEMRNMREEIKSLLTMRNELERLETKKWNLEQNIDKLIKSVACLNLDMITFKKSVTGTQNNQDTKNAAIDVDIEDTRCLVSQLNDKLETINIWLDANHSWKQHIDELAAIKNTI